MEIETKLKSLEEVYRPHAIYEDLGVSDKGSVHSYIPEYEKLLAPYREGSCVMEIGCNQCHSLKMWDEYFINSKLYGVDIWDGFVNYLSDEQKMRITVIVADATKPEFLDKFNYTLDVAIDDGSHIEADQMATYNLLKSKMNKGSIYIIEDILNPEKTSPKFEALGFTAIDLRKNKNRFDDYLLIKYF